MFLNHKDFKLLGLTLMVLLGIASCAPVPQPKILSISEQLVVDREKMVQIFFDFQKNTRSEFIPQDAGYLKNLASALGSSIQGFNVQQLEIRQMLNPEKFFAFPGTKIYLPFTFLKTVEFENELAAAIAFQLAQVTLRYGVKRLENEELPWSWQGGYSVFKLNQDEKREVIALAVQILYQNNFGTRALPSFFQRYSKYFEFSESEVEWMIREAHKARSEYLPLRDPIVRSKEFLEFKQRLQR